MTVTPDIRDPEHGDPEHGSHHTDGGGSATAQYAWVGTRPSGPTLAAAVFGITAVLWFAVELLRGYFWQDDFVFLYLGDTVPLPELLLRGYNGHLQPATFLLSWFVTHVAPLTWPVAVLPLVLMHGAAIALWWLFLVNVYGARWALLVPFLAVAFSPLTFVLSLWWAFALLLLPVELALFGALQAHHAHVRRGGTWAAVRSVLFVVAGLSFSEKAALIPAVLFGVTAALATGGFRHRVLDTLRRNVRLWLTHLVVLVGYVALHAWRAPLPDSSLPGLRDVASLTRTMVGDGLLPALFGGPWSGDWVGFRGLAPPATPVLVITWTLFGLVVLAGLALGGIRAVFAWLTLAGYLLVSILLVGSARLGPWGAIIGTDPRYVADSLPIAVLCAVVAVLLPRQSGSPEPVPSQSDEQHTDQPALLTSGPPARPGAKARRWVERNRGWVGGGARGLAIALAVALVAGAAASITGALPELRHQTSRDYVENIRAASRLEPGLVLYDSPVPAEVMLPLFGDNALFSHALRGLGISVDQPAEDLRLLDAAGTPRKIGLVSAVANRPIPVPACGFPIGPQASRIPLTQRAEGPRLVAQLGYYAQQASDGIVSTPRREFHVRFHAGLHLVSVVADGPFSEVLVQAEAPVCVTNVLVGLPLPHLS
jgi:hypothetical protein